ncbi:MAG: cadherin domain-containing protein [Magnetococcales bacterium]|nr:cadherin domain-containing protein [Magnetococcales bacterium]MBF0150993.1 cadherin domain-containing protein [Magnetococcales bacterium]
MIKLLQNKWLVAILIILGIAVAGAFLLMAPQTSTENKGITLDKLPQRQKQPDASKKEAPTAPTAPAREPVGSVTQNKGLAFAEFEKEKRILEEGAPIFQGDRIVTGSKARLILKMKDDAVIALGEDSEFLVQQYTFKVRPDNTVSEEDGNKGQVELTRGLAKFTSGRLGQLKTKPFHLVTPVATMGVRGTQGFIQLNGSGDAMGIEVITLKDEVLVWMEEPAKNLSSSSGELHFLTAFIAEAIAADLNKEPASVKKNQMLSGSRTTPPVIAAAPNDRLRDAHVNTAIKKLPVQAVQALRSKVAQSLVDKGAAANVEEAVKLLEQTPESVEKLVEQAEEALMEETKADVEAQVEKDKQLGNIEEEIKTAEAAGDTEKLAGLNEKKQALQSESNEMDRVIAGIDAEKSANAALEKASAKVEAFSEEITKKVAEGATLKDALENKATEAREEKKTKARALGIEDYDLAKKTADKVREETNNKFLGAAATPPPEGGEKPAPGTGIVSQETTKTGTGDGTIGGDAGKKDEGTGTQPADAKGGEKDATKTAPATDTKPGAARQDPNSVFADIAKSATTTTAGATGSTSSNDTNNKSTFSPTPITFNKPPVMAAQTFAIDENKPINSVVGTLVATDPNKADVLQFTLTPTDTFAIDAATGAITTLAALDFEKTSSYTLTATVTDNVPDNSKDKKITTITATITINVTNVNEPPAIVVPGALSVDEDDTLKVAGISVTDPDGLAQTGTTAVEPGELSVKLEAGKGNLALTDTSGISVVAGASGTKTVTLKGKLAGLNNALSKLGYAPEKDYHGSDTLKVDVDDLGTQGSGGPLTASASIVMTVKPVNDLPVFAPTEYKFTLDENKPVGTIVGSVTATDIEKETIIYDITKGNLGNAFTIDPASGQITVNKDAKIDAEANPVYTLEVGAKDGVAASQAGAIPAKVVIEIRNMNEPPIFKDLPTSIGALEDTIKVLNELQIDDPDLSPTSTETLKLTLSVEHGTLSTRPDHSIAEKSLTLTNTLANLRKELERLNYRGDSNFFGVDTLTLKLDDQGNIGAGVSIPATATVSISVTAVNDVPTLSSITDTIIDEDKPTRALSFQVGDLDTPASELVVTVASSNADLVPSANLLLSGTGTDRTLTVTPALNRFGEAVITLTAADKVNTSQTTTTSFKLTVRPVADKPVITSATTNEDVQTTAGLVITRAGVDGDEVTHVQIKNIVNGILYKKDGTTRINEGEFITIAEGNAGLKFTPGANLNSAGGTTAFGFDVHGATAAATENVGPDPVTAAISVTSINDAPIITKPANPTVIEDTKLVISGLSIADVDSGSAAIQVVLSVTQGTLTLAKTDGISIESGANGSETITFTGTLSGVNAALAGITYLGNLNSFGSDTLTIKANDQGNSGTNSTALTDEKTLTITSTAVNDAPVITRGTTTALTFTEGNAVGNNTALVIDSKLTVTDVDDTTLTGAILTISSGLDASKDQLDFTATSSIAKSWDATNGILTLTGSATVADYQTALRQVTFTSMSDDPAAGTRTITVKVSDGKLDSALASYSITVVPVNDAPSLTAGSTLNYTENDAATIIESAFTVTDLDNTTLTGGTVTISSGYQSDTNDYDTLAFTDSNGITGSWNATTGVLTLSGTATKAIYAAALKTITFVHTGDNPTSTSRTITTIVNDGSASSTAVTSTVAMTAVNDVPVVKTTASISVNEGIDTVQNVATVIDSQITITDAESDTLTAATIVIDTNFVNDEDVLIFPATLGNIQADITNGSDSGYNGWNATTGTLKLTGSGTVAEYQAALRTIQYHNLDSDVPTASTRKISFYVTDSGQSLAATASVTMVPQNDSPSLTAGTNLLPSYTEDSPTSKHADVIDDGITLADVDSTNLAGATVTITETYDSGKDLLAFSSNYSSTTITGSFNATTGVFTLSGTDTVANYQAALRAVTYANTSDHPTAGSRKVSFVINDGALSSNTTEVTFTVTPVNDAPIMVSGGTMTYTENDAATVIHSTLTVSDYEGDGLTGATVQITGNYSNSEDVLAFATIGSISGTWNAADGTLTLSGSGTVGEYQAALRTVTYANSSDNPTTLDRTLSFTVTESSPTVNGTTALTSTAVSATVTVVAVNDPPVLTAPTATITYTEDSPSPMVAIPIEHNDPTIDITKTRLTITDAETNTMDSATITISNIPTTTGDGPADQLQLTNPPTGITGTWDGTSKTLTLSGTASLDNYQTALRSVTYYNNSQDPGAGTRTLTWIVTDSGGGSATSTSVTSSLTVVAINDAPTITNGASAMAYIEDEEPDNTVNENHRKVISSTVTVSDVDNGSITGATVTITPATYQSGEDVLAATVQGNVSITSNTGGVLTLSGTDTKAVYQAVLRSVTYQNTSDTPNTTSRNVQFGVTDDGPSSSLTADSTANMQSTVSITATNDATVVTAGGTLTFTEQANATTIADQSDLAKQPAVVLDATVTVSDIEGNTMTGATVQITGNYDSGEDLLAFTTIGSISFSSWNSTTGTLTLTGSGTVSQYQAALRTVTYQNTNVGNPSALARTVTWTVTDSEAENTSSNSPTSAITVVPVNDSPLLSGGGTVLGYTENDAASVIDTSVTITDAENSTITGATVTISTNYHATDVGNNTQDALSYAGNGSNINAGVWNSTTGVLTLTTTSGQTATLADYMTAFDNVKYVSTSDAPHAGAGNQRTITWQVTDSGTVNSSSTTTTSGVLVTAVNDAPTDIQISNNGLYAASPVGTVIGSLTVTDPDLTTDTYTYTLTSGTTEFALVDGKDTSMYTAGNLAVNLGTLSNGVYTVTVQITDNRDNNFIQSSITFSKTLSITVVSAPFTSSNMTSVGDASAVATIAANARTLFNSVVSSLAGSTPTSISLTNDNLRTMILAKLNQQLTGSTSGLEHIGTIIDMMGISVTNTPKIEVTFRIKALSTMHSRLPASVRTSFWSLVDTITPYGAGYTFDLKLTVVPVINGNTITYDNTSSKLEVLHLKMLPDVLAPSTPYSIALDTLVSSYNGVLTNLKNDGTLTFFLGGAVPKHIVDAALGSASGPTEYQQMTAQGVWITSTGNSVSAPTSGTGVRLDYYLPGNINSVTFNTGNITLSPP